MLNLCNHSLCKRKQAVMLAFKRKARAWVIGREVVYRIGYKGEIIQHAIATLYQLRISLTCKEQKNWKYYFAPVANFHPMLGVTILLIKIQSQKERC